MPQGMRGPSGVVSLGGPSPGGASDDTLRSVLPSTASIVPRWQPQSPRSEATRTQAKRRIRHRAYACATARSTRSAQERDALLATAIATPARLRGRRSDHRGEQPACPRGGRSPQHHAAAHPPHIFAEPSVGEPPSKGAYEAPSWVRLVSEAAADTDRCLPRAGRDRRRGDSRSRGCPATRARRQETGRRW